MNSENKDFEIVMGDDTELNISEVGDITNTLKPNTSEKKKNIIIPIAMKDKEKSEKSEDDEENDENDENDEK